MPIMFDIPQGIVKGIIMVTSALTDRSDQGTGAILLTLIVVGSARTIDFPHQHYSVPTLMSQSYEQLENDFCFSIFPFNINQLIGSRGGDG